MKLAKQSKSWLLAGLKFLVRMASGWHYQLRSIHAANLPTKGGVLLVANHVSYMDALILSLASPRPIRFMSEESFFHVPLLGWCLRLFRGIPISSRRAKDGINRAVAALAAGEVVCLFPEGKLTRDGKLDEIQAGFQLIARKTQCPVVVAYLDGLWGSISSHAGGRPFTKLPRRLLRRVSVTFAAPCPAQQASPAWVASELQRLQCTAPAGSPKRRVWIEIGCRILQLTLVIWIYHLFCCIPSLGLLAAVMSLLLLALVMACGMLRHHLSHEPFHGH